MRFRVTTALTVVAVLRFAADVDALRFSVRAADGEIAVPTPTTVRPEDETETASDPSPLYYDGRADGKPVAETVSVGGLLPDGGGRRTDRGQWVQVVPAKSANVTRDRDDGTGVRVPAATAAAAGKPVWFGQIITDVLYNAPWSSARAGSECARQMDVYNKHLHNFTLWAAKSECALLRVAVARTGCNASIVQPK